jgi:hypothetical protein
MNSRRALCGPLVVLIVIAGGCGGAGLNSITAVATASPAAVTVPVNGHVTLQATVSGAGNSNPVFSWGVEQSAKRASGWGTRRRLDRAPMARFRVVAPRQ